VSNAVYGKTIFGINRFKVVGH